MVTDAPNASNQASFSTEQAAMRGFGDYWPKH